MSGTASPDSEDSIPLAPPFSPVQVMSSLPPLGTDLALSSRVVSMMESSHSESGKNQHTGSYCQKQSSLCRPNASSANPTGLSRAEIRLLGEVVRRFVNVHRDELDFVGVAPDDLLKAKAAVKKLKTASGYNFSGRKKK